MNKKLLGIITTFFLSFGLFSMDQQEYRSSRKLGRAPQAQPVQQAAQTQEQGAIVYTPGQGQLSRELNEAFRQRKQYGRILQQAAPSQAQPQQSNVKYAPSQPYAAPQQSQQELLRQQQEYAAQQAAPSQGQQQADQTQEQEVIIYYTPEQVLARELDEAQRRHQEGLKKQRERLIKLRGENFFHN